MKLRYWMKEKLEYVFNRSHGCGKMDKGNCLGTLGDNQGFLTCSMHIAQKWDRYKKVIPYGTFEAAAQDLKTGKIEAMLVPAAYSDICDFIMDEKLTVSELFIEPIPPIVCVAKKNDFNMLNVRRVYLHHATKSLVYTMAQNVNIVEKVYVDSNIEACKKLISDDKEYSISITNKLCADYYGLKIIKVLREEVLMPWVCIIRKNGKNTLGIGEKI